VIDDSGRLSVSLSVCLSVCLPVCYDATIILLLQPFVTNIAKLELFHMTNQRRILGIFWYEFITNVEVATLSELSSINEAISRRRHSLFGHVRSMDQAAPAHQALSHLATGLRTV